MEFTNETLVIIFAALLSLSEFLALIPGVKANSVFQLVINIIKKAKEVFSK
jgi:hypothetical protein